MTYSNDLNPILNQASPVPEMPTARIHDGAMAAFPARKPPVVKWAAIAASLVIGVAGVMALQTYQAQKQTMMADADAFAEQLVSDVY